MTATTRYSQNIPQLDRPQTPRHSQRGTVCISALFRSVAESCRYSPVHGGCTYDDGPEVTRQTARRQEKLSVASKIWPNKSTSAAAAVEKRSKFVSSCLTEFTRQQSQCCTQECTTLTRSERLLFYVEREMNHIRWDSIF